MLYSETPDMSECVPLDQGTQVALDTNSVMCKKRCVCVCVFVCVCVCVCMCVYVCVCIVFYTGCTWVHRWEQTRQSSSAKRWSPTTTTRPN